jgi:HEPN domain-containing protein
MELYSGAYYLAGYSVECALKACLARETNRYDFPDKQRVNASYTHSLEQLVKVAELNFELQKYDQQDSKFQFNWRVTRQWSEESRYQLFSSQKATELISAISERKHGVIAWVKRYW